MGSQSQISSYGTSPATCVICHSTQVTLNDLDMPF